MAPRMETITLPLSGTVPIISDKPSSKLLIIAYPIGFFVLAFIKAPNILLEPRFWAEEGHKYFPLLRDMSFFQAIQHTYVGSYLGLTNIFVFIATRVPLKYAPYITTYMSLLLHLLVAIQIGISVRAFRMHQSVGALILISWAFLPQTYEVWLTSTNSQWVCGVSVLFLFFLPKETIRNHIKALSLLSFICGFSGIPATIPAPIFLLRGLIEKSRPILIIGCVISLFALLQFLVVLHSETPGRPYSLDGYFIFLPIILQSIISPLFSVDFSSAIAQSIKIAKYNFNAEVIGLLANSLIIMYTIIKISRGMGEKYLYLYILMLWSLVSIVQTYGSLADLGGLISGWAGGRYYLFGSMCLILMLSLGSMSKIVSHKYMAILLLLLVCIICVVQRYTSSWMLILLQGPSWTEQLSACNYNDGPCRIYLWPEGGSWYIDLPSDKIINKN